MRVRRTAPNPRSMGLDISMRGTGVIIQDTKTEAVLCEKVIKSNSNKLPNGPGLWVHNRDIVMELVAQYEPTVVYIEDFAFGQANKAHALGANAGVIRTGLYEMGVDVHLVGPTVLKKFVSGKGNCSKDVIIKEVWKRWKYDTNDNNLADAYALSEMGAMYLRGVSTRTFAGVMAKVIQVKGLRDE